MRRVNLTLGVLLGLTAAAFADVGKEELKKLAQAGLSEALILSYVRAKGPLARLSAEDVVDLKKSGLSDSLLSNLLALQEPAVGGAIDSTPKPASTVAATAKLLSDPDIVWDGRAFYPRSYFSSNYAAYSSHAIGASVINPGWYGVPWTGYVRWSYGWGSSYVRTGGGFCSSGGRRICYR